MSVDMCSNKFSEWWQQGEHGWPIEPQCAEYTLAREAFRQGWVAAQNTKELGTTPNRPSAPLCEHCGVVKESLFTCTNPDCDYSIREE